MRDQKTWQTAEILRDTVQTWSLLPAAHPAVSQPVWWAARWSGLSWWWRRTASWGPRPPGPTWPPGAWWRSWRSARQARTAIRIVPPRRGGGGVQYWLHQRAPTYLWVVGEHVVPQDGGPGVWHLADVRNDDHRQGVSLQSRGLQSAMVRFIKNEFIND